MPLLDCAHCGVKFEGYAPRKFCSTKCSAEAQRTLPEQTCENCEKPFRPDYSKRPQRTCSRKCRSELAHRNSPPPPPPFEPYVKACEAEDCDASFEVTSRRVRKYCSNSACYNRRASKAIMDRYYRDPEFRDRVITASHARNVRKLGIPGVVNLTTLISYLMDRDDGICKLCRKPVTYQEASPDHRIPLSRGGHHVVENLQLAHLICNLRKNNKLDAEFREYLARMDSAESGDL